MATVTPTKRNSYVVITSPISPPEQTSKRTRDEYFETSSKRHCPENSYGHLHADCSSYTFRTTTNQQPSFQKNLWPGSSDVHTNASSMLDTHGAHSSHKMSICPSHSDFSKEILVPFTQAPLTQERSVSPRNRQFSQQKSIAPVESSILRQILSAKKTKSSKQKSVESSKHKDVFLQGIVIPNEVEYDKVSKNIPCLDMISTKNIPQGCFDQNDVSLKAQETQQKQPEANISPMISDSLKQSDLNDVIHIEECSLIDTSLLEWGIEEFNIDLASELEKWCQNTRHGINIDQKESFRQQNKFDQSEDPDSSSNIPQTEECQLVKGSINGDFTVSQSDSQQINVLEPSQISSPFDLDMPKSNACQNDNDSAYCSTSPSIKSNEEFDWAGLCDTILSLNGHK